MFLSCWHVMVRTLTHCCVLTCSWCGEGSLTFLMFLCRGTGVITSTVKVASQRWRTGCLETSTLWPSSSSSSLCCRYSLIHALHQYWYCINTASILILYQYCINTDWFVLVFTGLFWFVLVCAVAHVPDVSVSDGGDIPGPDSDLWHPKGQIQLLKWPLQKAESKPAGRGLCVLGRSLSVWGGV